MGSKPPTRKRQLTAEEAELWTRAMRDAKALRRRERADKRSGKAVSDGEWTGEISAEQTGPPPADTSSQRAGLPSPPSRQSRATPPVQQQPPPLANFEDRHRRKLARNAEQIDARMDLHGMRQREAHAALRAFLLASAARGHRNVLIITGKGTRAEIERTRDYFIEERGVLRRLVPQWLGEPEFRGIVLSMTTASARHGGEGALYVRLRRSSGKT
ncbi:MAG: Smr/MutS family protein [Rhodomicrobiaceae bacterium]